MIKVFCGVCGATADRDIDEADYSCDACEMGAGMSTIDADPEEREKLRNIIGSLGKQVLTKNPVLGSSILPAFRHAYKLSVSVLDLFVVFFERISLLVDSIGFEDSETSQLEDRIRAYSEAGFVTPLYVLPTSEDESSKRIQIGVDLDSNFRKVNEVKEYSRRLEYYLQMIGELETQDDIKRSPNEYAYLDREWYGNPKHAHPSLLLNRSNIYSAVADCINSSVLFDSILTKARTVKYQHRFSLLNTRREALDYITSWYGDEICSIPSFKKPETVIAFRDSEAGCSFVDTIVREYMTGAREGNPKAIERHLTELMNQKLSFGRRVTGESYDTKKTILSGLFTTFGSLIGGATGAIMGGIGGNAIVLAAERLDKTNVPPWASFFIHEEKRNA